MRREEISVPGLDHGDQPIPIAVTMTGAIGGLLVTGGINGRDPKSGELPEDVEDEVNQVFANLRAILEEAGCTEKNVAKVTVFTPDRTIRELVNRAWIETFPDPDSRPARHTLVHQLPNGMRIQLDCLAVLPARS